MKMIELNQIVCGDCIEKMKGLPDKCVDIIFADPPYNAKKDYGIYKDNRFPEKYKEWMAEVVNHSRRISRKGIVFYVGGKLTKLFCELIPTAHLIIVHKRAIGPIVGNYFLQYHSLFSTVKPIKKTKDLWNDIRLPGEGYYFREQRYDTPGLTSQKLTEKVIDTFSVRGDILLDPFMGTGTTAIGALKLGRRYIGIELNPEYINVAIKRIAKEINQGKLFE